MDEWERVVRPKIGEVVILPNDEKEMKIVSINRFDIGCEKDSKIKTIKKWYLRYPRKETNENSRTKI